MLLTANAGSAAWQYERCLNLAEPVFDYLETIVFINADVLVILGIEITGKLPGIQPGEHRRDQPACNPLLLARGIYTDKKQVIVRIGSMFFMKSINSG